MVDPLTVIAIAKVTGLTDFILSKFGDSPSANVAKKVVETAIKVSGAKNEADVIQILNADPVKAAQVAEAIRAQETELINLAYADLSNARAMQIAALNQSDIFSKRFVYYFIAMWTVFSMAYLVAVTFEVLPPSNIRYADLILGFLFGTALSSSFQYLLGTSVASKVKDQTISNLSKG